MADSTLCVWSDCYWIVWKSSSPFTRSIPRQVKRQSVNSMISSVKELSLSSVSLLLVWLDVDLSVQKAMKSVRIKSWSFCCELSISCSVSCKRFVVFRVTDWLDVEFGIQKFKATIAFRTRERVANDVRVLIGVILALPRLLCVGHAGCGRVSLHINSKGGVWFEDESR